VTVHLDRRQFLLGAGAAGLGLVLAGCSAGTPAAQKTSTASVPATFPTGPVSLTMFVWAGSNQNVVPEAVVRQYEKDHPNVKINIVESNNTVTYPKMIAAKKTTPDQNYVDFGFFNASTFAQGDVDGMWEPLNLSKIPNSRHVLPEYIPSNHSGLGYQNTIMGLAYNTKDVPAPPTSWTELWSSKNVGKVTTFDYQWEALVVAARLNGGSEKDIQPGFDIWSKHAKNFTALVSSNDQLQNLLVTGDAWYAPWFQSITAGWTAAGAPLGYVTPKEGAIAFPAYLCTVTNLTPDQRFVAYDVINQLLEPENAGRYGELTSSIPLTDNAKLSDAQKSNPDLQLSVARNAMQFDWATIAKNNTAWTAEWNSEVKANMG